MSQENLEIVRIGYERYAATGEFTDDIATADFVWDMSNFHGWPEQQVYEGAEGARTFLREWRDAWDDWSLEIDALHDAGDKVVALLRQHGRSKAAGMPVEMLFARSGPSAMARRLAWTCIPTGPRPSKPPDCRNIPRTRGRARAAPRAAP